ncbi:NLI interacting factor-like phosphatase [Filimonas lacunae]|uniref:NLI interacting factor-like phosphatase n=1 Tax=Filimonas lacunae TaxID=477680 RepID=A0A1N7PYL4_9BACT|nr:HAD family hydrolase [Filimonas lacunae]SIT15635.1 NLI interacting factor-like phosphatase [Filimonas lacunae]
MATDKPDKLLLLDLDETLVHATVQPLNEKADFVFDVYHVYKRPGVEQFLQEISQHFVLGVWSSADDAYVEEIVKTITPASVEWAMVWGKTRCTLKRDYQMDNYYWEKKLDKVKKKGFQLEQVIIVDDSPQKSRSNYGNAVYIHPFEGDGKDEELTHLFTYLLTLKEVENIRAIEKRGWRNRNS